MVDAALIYDGDCPLCTKAVEWVQAHARPGAIEVVPCQAEERAVRFPQVSSEDCMRAVQLVYPDGRVYSGEAALPHLFHLMGGRWAWFARFFGLPGVSLLAPRVYRWVAAHRYALSRFVVQKDPCKEDTCGGANDFDAEGRE